MKLLIAVLVLFGATAFSQTVLIGMDVDVVTSVFESNRACSGLRGVILGTEKFDYALTTHGNREGTVQLILIKNEATPIHYAALGPDARKGTERACEIVKGRRAAICRSF
jgi:hypothetical protein